MSNVRNRKPSKNESPPESEDEPKEMKKSLFNKIKTIASVWSVTIVIWAYIYFKADYRTSHMIGDGNSMCRDQILMTYFLMVILVRYKRLPIRKEI